MSRSRTPSLFDPVPPPAKPTPPPEPTPEPTPTPAPAAETVWSVADLVGGLRELLEAEYGDVRVEGEVSNFKRHTSGHCYFTLKDGDAQLRCVMWRHFTRYLGFQPQDGMRVRARGNVSLYERRGDLQLLARSLRPAGEGALQKAFEELKRRLDAEGLFDAARKRRLPPYPETIGVVTSGSGAALHDVLSVLQRRFPQVRVLVCPVQVQGVGAAASIAEAVDAFGALDEGDPMRPDVLIVGRGGGAAEDLWAFNEEPVARAIAACAIPVVSAVGHETDVTIADFVADVRAATPSMAAELAVPDRRDVAAHVQGLCAALAGQVRARIDDGRQRVRHLTASRAFHRPVDRLHQTVQRVDDLAERLAREARHGLAGRRQRLAALEQRLLLLDPQRPLRQGYARVERDGRRVRLAADLQTDDRLKLCFADGARAARVEPPPADDADDAFSSG